MRYNRLGNSGLIVSELCLGAMTFGDRSGGRWANIHGLTQDDSTALVKQALEAFSYNKGGHGGRATLSRESAMRALLARTPAGGAGMKRIRYRAPRRQPR